MDSIGNNARRGGALYGTSDSVVIIASSNFSSELPKLALCVLFVIWYISSMLAIL